MSEKRIEELVKKNKELKASLNVMNMMFTIGFLGWFFDRFNLQVWGKVLLAVGAAVAFFFLVRNLVALIRLKHNS